MNKLFISLIVLAACGLSACDDHQKYVTLRELVVASQIRNAPARSILLYDQRRTSWKWGMVCTHEKNGDVTSSAVGYSGVWMCGSAAATANQQSPVRLARLVTRVITPSDPDYQGQIEEQMLLMLDPPRNSR